MFFFFQTFYDIAVQLPNANIATTVTSLTTIIILFFLKEFLAPKLKKILKFPIPFDLIVVSLFVLKR